LKIVDASGIRCGRPRRFESVDVNRVVGEAVQASLTTQWEDRIAVSRNPGRVN